MADPVRYAIPPALAAMETDRHQAIEASAGTGKTYLIERRVADLILRGGVGIDRILVVTFTEKATAELRRRIRALLVDVADATEHTAEPDEPHWRIDAAARTRLRDAIAAFDQAAIHTIHGFCQRVLTENAFTNRRLFEQVPVATETAFADAFRAALRERWAVDPDDRPYLEAWLAQKTATLGSLERLLFECTVELGAAGAGPDALEPRFDLARWHERLSSFVERATEWAHDDWGTVLRGAGVHGRSVAKVARQLDGALRAFDGAGGAQASPVQMYRAMAGIELDPEYLATPLARCRDTSLADAAAALAEVSVPLSAAVARQLLPAVVDRLRVDKNRRGQFDFQDMLRLVWEALESDAGPALAARLRARHRHALIDEFQDTDELQWRIFRRLYLEGSQGTLSIIGDPKQAIYAFRGADVHTYLHAHRTLVEHGGRSTPLVHNYRSSAGVVAAYNAILCEGVAGGPFFTGGIDYEHPVEARATVAVRDRRGAAPAPAHVFALEPAADESPRIEHHDAALLARITREIHALAHDPDAALTITRDGEARRLGAGDIFVLTRKTREADDVASSLRTAGVRCVLYRQEGLFQTTEAREVHDLLAGIADPRDRSARFKAWQTRFFDVSLSDLPRLRELPDTHPLVERLYRWKALADQLDYEALFPLILAESGIIERELFFEGSERALTNIEHIFELLGDEVLRSRCEIHELALRVQRWIDETEQSPSDDRDVQRLESDADAVQIMTVHKAKGLEAPIVFLYGGFSSFGIPGSVKVYHDDRNRRRIRIGKLPDEIKADVAREQSSEDQRLLYVGLTRASARLYLPMARRTANDIKGYLQNLNARLERIVDARDGDAELRRLFDVEPVPLDAGVPDTERPTPRLAPSAWTPPAELLQPPELPGDLDTACRDRAGFQVTSYSGLKTGATKATVELAPDVDAVADERDDELPGGAAIGVFLHELLEKTPPQLVRECPDLEAWRVHPEVAGAIDEAMLRHGIDPGHRADVEAIIHRALTAALPGSDGRVLAPVGLCERLMRETEFYYPVGDRIFVKGYIDAVVEQDGRLYLIDWKSDILPDYHRDTLARHVDEHYELQASVYGVAAARMLDVTDAASWERVFGGMLFVFLRGLDPRTQPSPGVHAIRPAFDDLRRFESGLPGRLAP